MRVGRLTNRTNLHDAEAGSALILTVVLTSLLAMVGVLLVMVTRIDKMATSAVAENQELTLAVDTVTAQISELLAQDVPGVTAGQEYYDFPDANNPWLADLEPYYDVADGTYRWRQISRIAGGATFGARNVLIDLIGERDAIVDVNGAVTNADADGDGVGDSLWFEVPGITSSKGKPIYAAVRIVDNGGMLNINTGYWFDPNRADPSFEDPTITDASQVDGSSPLQINAIALAGKYDEVAGNSDGYASDLLAARRIDPVDGLAGYENWVLWRYLRPDPNNPYTPFDLSDELELRYRFLLNHLHVDTRAENWGRFKDRINNVIETPVDALGDLDKWFARVHDANGLLDPNYAYRHVATTYNMDRIIVPEPFGADRKMVNVNTASEDEIREAVQTALLKTGRDPLIVGDQAAQITANILDYIDDDDAVSIVEGPSTDPAYGFERPCVYISELAYNAVTDGFGIVHRSYAVELFKPYFEDPNLANGQWRLVIDNPATPSAEDVVQPIVWSGLRRFHVLLAEDPVAELFNDSDFVADLAEPADTVDRFGYDRLDYANPRAQTLDDRGFAEGATFLLQRQVAPNVWATVDYVTVARDGWMNPDQGSRSIQRDISLYKCIRRLWTPSGVTPITLGSAVDQYVDPNEGNLIQAHPANRTLRNIGELGMVFAEGADSVRSTHTAEDVLLDLANPDYARLFNYLTVIDPAEHLPLPTETRIMGRININTAPWFVLAQLPWIQYQDNSAVKSTRARAMVDYRDIHGAYENIGGLMQVTALHDLAHDDRDNLNDEDPDRGPDLTDDSARDDLEERDLLFTRMSNLVTVRSDVFTAYILVRLGADGPQKRMMAILDRSRTGPRNPRVRIVALHPSADPR